MQKRAQAVIVGLGLLDDGVDHFAIGKLRAGTGKMGNEFFSDTAGELLGTGENESFKLVHIRKWAAIGKDESGVHGEALCVVANITSWDGDDFVLRTFRNGAVVGAPATGDVKVLKRETGRIELRMANRAGRLVAMFVELLADGGGAANVRLNGGHVLRRWIRRRAKNSIKHVSAAHHG